MKTQTNTRTRSGLVATLVGASALTATAQAQSGWFNLQPAYNTETESPTLRLESGADLGKGFDLYGFVDIDASKERSFDLETFYGEARLSYSLEDISDSLKGFKLATEYNGGSNVDDLMRLGIKYDTSLGKGNYLSLRAFPFETSGDAGPKIGIFTTQDLTDRISAQVLLNYYPDSKSFYLEPEVNFKIGGNTSLFLQGRSFGELNKDLISDMTPVIGIKFKF